MATIRQNAFNGNWYVPGMGSKYKGELIHEEDENLWALHFTDRHDDASLTELVRNPSKCIQGELENGSCVLLVDLEARHAGGQLLAYDDYLLFPKYILEGIRTDSEAVELGYLAFDFDDIVHWSGMCHFHYRGDNVEWEQEPEVIFECSDHTLKENLSFSDSHIRTASNIRKAPHMVHRNGRPRQITYNAKHSTKNYSQRASLPSARR